MSIQTPARPPAHDRASPPAGGPTYATTRKVPVSLTADTGDHQLAGSQPNRRELVVRARAGDTLATVLVGVDRDDRDNWYPIPPGETVRLELTGPLFCTRQPGSGATTTVYVIATNEGTE